MKKWFLFALVTSIFIGCEKEKRECPGATEKTYSLTDFQKVKAGETFNLSITKGNNFSVVARGCADDLADLDLSVSPDKQLEMKFKNYKPGRYRVDFTITLPFLSTLNLDGAAKAVINGFGGQTSTVRNVLKGSSECNMTGAAINVQVDLSGTAILSVTGDTESLYGNIYENARLHSYGTRASEVDIFVSGTAKAYVQPINEFYAEAAEAARVYYKGNPPVSSLVTSGSGKIIREE